MDWTAGDRFFAGPRELSLLYIFQTGLWGLSSLIYNGYRGCLTRDKAAAA
jgi:hypothetical protein